MLETYKRERQLLVKKRKGLRENLAKELDFHEQALQTLPTHICNNTHDFLVGFFESLLLLFGRGVSWAVSSGKALSFACSCHVQGLEILVATYRVLRY